jgi:hypothetical protein
VRISEHARARFRSRYMRPGEAEELGARVTDEWLWGLVRLALKEGRVEEVIDEGRPLRVIELAPRDPGGDPVFACQRPDEDDAIVSLLEKWQRDNNRMTRWRRRGGSVGLGATLGERLAHARKTA